MGSKGRPPAKGNESTRDASSGSIGPDGYGLILLCEAGTTSHSVSRSKRIVLGRAPSCDVVIDDASVSREHAVIHPGSPPHIEDLRSRNGTHVHGERLSKGARHPLTLGMVVQLGTATLVVQRDRVSVAAPRKNARTRDVPAHRLVIEDPTMQQLYRMIDVIAPSTMCVLVLGETGVGKEIFAETIHERSARAGHCLRLNCAALSETLLESELFGHEKGAFTGAVQSKPGLFESADGGTVFLDEVGELTLATQAKLLRVLESGEVLRIGSVRSQHVDVRFVSATNRDLELDVASGRFRADLFYRLNGITLTLPPLRERPKDIDALADAFVEAASQKAGKTAPSLSKAARAALREHSWPGNIRELRNTIERATLLCDGAVIEAEALALGRAARTPREAAPSTDLASPGVTDLRSQMESFERQRIVAALEQCAGNQTRAAKLLKISRRSLVGKLTEYKIRPPK